MRAHRATIWAMILTAAAASPAAARDPLLGQPIDCTLGNDCYIQNYHDADGGPGAADFTCGSLSYDGHGGTDFALPNHRAALAGVHVLAAAPGRVRAVRDGVADHFLGAQPDFPDGQDCGNGVVIDHGGGWETQYCHLKQGSVTVQTGQRVAMGAPLGLIGMSGRTQFPHLHLTVRDSGQKVDPFNTDQITTCGETGDDHLWQTSPNYVPGGLIQTGFAPMIPTYDTIKWGDAHSETLNADAPALVFWAHLFGVRAGDELRLSITGPAGLFHQDTIQFEAPKAQLFRALGRKLHAENRVPGPYSAHAVLIRKGQEIARMSATTTLAD